MSKLDETTMLINYPTTISKAGLNKVDNNTVVYRCRSLADIAKSLAMIADKLCGEESENKE
jgi:hypothetical protein